MRGSWRTSVLCPLVFLKHSFDGHCEHCCCSVSKSCPTLCDPMDCSPPGFPVSQYLAEFAQTRPLSQWCHLTISSSATLLSFCLQPFPASVSFPVSRLFGIRWPKYWSFSFSISPSDEYSGLISFRMDWLDLLVVQGILKSLHQHHSSKVSILWCSAFFIVQLSYPYMTIGKTIALTIWAFIGKVMFLVFNTLSRFVLPFLPRSKYLNFMAALTVCSDLGAEKNKIYHCFYFSPFYLWTQASLILYNKILTLFELIHSANNPWTPPLCQELAELLRE